MNVSVLLTLYNEEKGVRRVLNYLSSQTDIFQELLIVSDNCHDATDEICAKWLESTDIPSKTFITRHERHGRGDAIRLGLTQAANDLCVIMAGDINPEKQSLGNLVRYFRNPRVGAVTGHPVLLNGYRTIGDCLCHLMWESHDNVGEKTTREGIFFHLNGEMFAVRKHFLEGAEFNCLNEDSMIGYIVKSRGGNVKWARDVQYEMMYPHGFWEWVKIRKRSCYGRIELIRKTGLKAYAFYELKHSDYVGNVWRIAVHSPKLLASLAVGAPMELLLRLHYQVSSPIPLSHSKLWQPASQTKW
jgi:cellulose synthase/poly-beta-1,6-N-acetylglucosamine synthase-like glycosyltransferase